MVPCLLGLAPHTHSGPGYLCCWLCACMGTAHTTRQDLGNYNNRNHNHHRNLNQQLHKHRGIHRPHHISKNSVHSEYVHLQEKVSYPQIRVYSSSICRWGLGTQQPRRIRRRETLLPFQSQINKALGRLRVPTTFQPSPLEVTFLWCQWGSQGTRDKAMACAASKTA